MLYDIQKRIFLVQKYYEIKHFTLIQRAFRTKYKSSTAPNQNTIINLINDFEKIGSVAFVIINRKKSSEKRIVAQNQLKSMIDQFPNLSIRKAASAVEVSTTLVFNFIHDDLHLKPYKFHQWHKLEAHDYEKRMDFAHWFLSLPMDTKYFHMQR